MPRTLISFIGTGPTIQAKQARAYRTAAYTLDGKDIGTGAFIASVLADMLLTDRLILIGTVRSMWEEVYRFFAEKNGLAVDEDYWLALAELSENGSHKSDWNGFDFAELRQVLGDKSRVLLIPYGLDKQEHYDIFQVLTEAFKSLPDGEEVYLDVTHGFRSLPLFSLTSLLYLQDVLQTSVRLEKIYYGMLEASGEFDGKTPVVDLSLVFEIQNWIKAAYAFMQFGKGGLTADLLTDKQQQKTVREFSDALSLNYLTKIEKQLHNFRSVGMKIDQPLAKLFLPPVLTDFTDRLLHLKTQAAFQLELSIWHFEKSDYSSAYIVFVESLVTYVCEQENLAWQEIFDRQYAKNELKKGQKYKSLRKIYKSCNKIRNAIAHNNRLQTAIGKTDLNALSEYQIFFKNKII